LAGGGQGEEWVGEGGVECLCLYFYITQTNARARAHTHTHTHTQGPKKRRIHNGPDGVVGPFQPLNKATPLREGWCGFPAIYTYIHAYVYTYVHTYISCDVK